MVQDWSGVDSGLSSFSLFSVESGVFGGLLGYGDSGCDLIRLMHPVNLANLANLVNMESMIIF